MKSCLTSMWDVTGFKIVVRGNADGERVMVIGDLNPEVKIVQVMSRWAMFRVGLWLIKRAWRSL